MVKYICELWLLLFKFLETWLKIACLAKRLCFFSNVIKTFINISKIFCTKFQPNLVRIMQPVKLEMLKSESWVKNIWSPSDKLCLAGHVWIRFLSLLRNENAQQKILLRKAVCWASTRRAESAHRAAPSPRGVHHHHQQKTKTNLSSPGLSLIQNKEPLTVTQPWCKTIQMCCAQVYAYASISTLATQWTSLTCLLHDTSHPSWGLADVQRAGCMTTSLQGQSAALSSHTVQFLKDGVTQSLFTQLHSNNTFPYSYM